MKHLFLLLLVYLEFILTSGSSAPSAGGTGPRFSSYASVGLRLSTELMKK